MLTFNGKPELKARLISFAASLRDRIAGSEKHGERQKLFFSSRQWCPSAYICQKGEGCDHRFYADEIGVPVAIAYTEHALFLELPKRAASNWWPRFLSAIPVGVAAEVTETWFPALAQRLLTDKQHGMLQYAADGEQHAAIAAVLALFEQDSTDESAWEAAAKAANAVYHKGPYNNRRMEAAEARQQAGAEACLAAAHLAWAYKDPRHAAEAVQWSGWCARYSVYSQHLQVQHDPRKDVKTTMQHGIAMVNVGESLWAGGQWMRQSDEGNRLGEVARAEHYAWLANELVSIIHPGICETARHLFSGWLHRKVA